MKIAPTVTNLSQIKDSTNLKDQCDLGGGYLEIQEGFYATLVNTRVDSDISYNVQSFQMVGFNVMLSGDIFLRLPKDVHIKPREAFVTATNEHSEWVSELKIGSELQSVGVFLTPEWFQLNEKFFKSDTTFDNLYDLMESKYVHQTVPYSRKLNELASNMLSLPQCGFVCALRLEAHAIDMLLTLASVANSTSYQSPLRVRDRDRIHAIKESIDNNLAEISSLAELSAKFGISASKLKRDFRACHNTCISSYIMDRRLERGCLLLQEGFRVSEVAYRLGYLHPSNFATAFRRRYGVSPKEARTKYFEMT